MDTLFLIRSGFHDPEFPNRTFYCWHCVLIEGLLATYPELEKRIEVKRVDWLRPRRSVIAVVGVENQSLPLLVLSEGKASKYQTGSGHGRSFISDKDALLLYFAEEYGIPEPHP